MRPFRSRLQAAIALSFLLLALFQGAVTALEVPDLPGSFPEDPPPTLSE